MRTFKELTPTEQKMIRIFISERSEFYEPSLTDEEISTYFNLKLSSIYAIKSYQTKGNNEFKKELLGDSKQL